MKWLIDNYVLLQGIYVIATIALTLVIAWTSISSHFATKSFNKYQQKLDSNRIKSSISSIYYDLIYNISRALKILRYIEKEKKISDDIHIVMMDNWAENVSNINFALDYREIYEINTLYKRLTTIQYLLAEKSIEGLTVQLQNLKSMIINKYLNEYTWIDFSMRYEYMFNLKYLTLFHRMRLLLEDAKDRDIIEFIDSSVSKQVNYKYNDELIINGKFHDGILKEGTLSIKNDNKVDCINIKFNENTNDHIIIYKDTEKLVDADYTKDTNQYDGFKTVYNSHGGIHFQGKLKGDEYINGCLYENMKYVFTGELKNGKPYNGKMKPIKKGRLTELNRIFNFEGVLKKGQPFTGKGAIFDAASNSDIEYNYCVDEEEQLERHMREQEYYEANYNYEEGYKQDLAMEGKDWIDVKSVEWKDGQIVKEGSIETYEY